MDERHDQEQYFFDEATLARLSAFVARYENPCVICAPMLGQRLVEQGQQVAILDVDERFADLPGFRRFDLLRPEWIGDPYDLILCDPPFFNVSLRQLESALRMLSRNDYAQPLLVGYLRRRADALCRALDRFGLVATGYCPTYETVDASERNRIEFFGNLPDAATELLRG